MDGLRGGLSYFKVGFYHIATIQLRGGLKSLSVEAQDQLSLVHSQLEPNLNIQTCQPSG
jgi:hypothetical protein